MQLVVADETDVKVDQGQLGLDLGSLPEGEELGQVVFNLLFRHV